MRSLEEEFRRIYQQSQRISVSEHALDQSKRFADGFWREYTQMLEPYRKEIKGAVALDFGCKFGHVLPVMLAMGAKHAIGVDVVPDYFDASATPFRRKLYDPGNQEILAREQIPTKIASDGQRNRRYINSS